MCWRTRSCTSPWAPHTLPDVARLKIDRRLIPGDDPDLAIAEFTQAIGDIPPYEVKVEKGPVMLPALVEPGDPGVRALMQAHQRRLRLGATDHLRHGHL